ncbi:hypothetical protein KII95_07945 [Leuconostoc gelidum subsp. aenigmaticum]|uniref:peptidoglycan amidohydrolase family protein n=1 Tax=Leuconostoc gelidum TaxID=1244 RepID=UPI001CC7E63C|nr:peptidoglycan amidohydrolase family protein [Leuconostoc gelidum]MBZ6003944.1 hypothetical protein [Leuconostoc gelidum subsp. aenigmaticum]
MTRTKNIDQKICNTLKWQIRRGNKHNLFQGITALVIGVSVLLTLSIDKINASSNHNGNIDQNKIITWFKNNEGRLTYSMSGSRNGSDGTADCSGSMTQAIYEAGGKPYDWLYNTDYLHDYLIENNYKLVAENADWSARKNDIVIWGSKGQSGGTFGHVGVISRDDPNANFLSTSYYTGGQIGTAVKNINYNQFARLDNFPYTYVYRYENLDDEHSSVSHDKTVHFDHTFDINQYTYWNGEWDVINNALSIPLTDYNNYIPLSGIMMTDEQGNTLANQFAQIGTQKREYFRLNGHYNVKYDNGKIMAIEISGEPVWIQSKYAVTD